MKRDDLYHLIQKSNFDHYKDVDPKLLKAVPEVRDMCREDKCRAYNKSWTCPPACGTVEECETRMRQYRSGILVQTTAVLEDSFDYEGMMEGERTHKERFSALCRDLGDTGEKFLPLGSGGCRICETCTYPNAPCRFPQRAMSSMEAYGLLVSQVCRDNGLPYYYGSNTVTYTSMILLEPEIRQAE